MTGQQLKNSILQLAIQGKLVPQNPDDEPASELLKRIRAEKEKLIKEKKIKKEKPLPEISGDEKPFEIPDNWVWCRLGEIFSMQAGKNINASKINTEKKDNAIYECFGGNGIRGFVSEYNNEGPHPIIGRQGALCGCVNMAYGKFYATEHAVVVSYFAGTDVNLIKFFLTALNLNQYATATAQPGLSVEKVSYTLFPLPPLQEQHRIVEKIEELMPLVDKYDKAQKRFDVLNANIPEALKKSILQEAIQGKLGTNNPDDESASELLKRIRAEKEKLIKEKAIKKEKPLPEISEDEKPFEIPEGWVWCRLGEICEFLSRGRSPKYADEIRKYPVFAQKCNLKNGGISLEQARFLDPATICKWNDIYKLRDGDVLVNSTGTGTVGRTRLFNTECLGSYPFVVPDSHVSVVRTFGCICSAYIYNCLISDNIQKYFEENLAGSTNQKELYIGTLGNTLIPLPPLQEQHRIVEKLNELLPKLETLK